MEKAKNINKNKKSKVAILIGAVALFLAVLGATYAYFQISTGINNSNTTITGSTPTNGLVTLKGVTNNLHLNISSNDMSLVKITKEYYATDAEDKSYEDNENDGIKRIVLVEVTGGEESTIYSCTAKLTVSKVTEEENADTMIDVLILGDMILQFKGNIISDRLDLSELNPSGSKEYNLNFKVTRNMPEEIQAFIKLVNKNENQNYLAGRKLNIDINTSDLKCNIYIPDPKIAELRTKDTQRYLSEDLQGGMYRYQGTGDVSNWICFGTKSKDDCTNSDSGIDKYMYRIIGITEEGKMYLIKETFIKEETSTSFAWNDKHSTSGTYACDNKICPEWGQNNLFKRLNGISDGTTQGSGSYNNNADTDIFVDSAQYDYLKSGDKSNGGDLPSEWYDLIVDHEWMYGDTTTSSSDVATYTGDIIHAVETGKADTKHYVGVDGNNKEEIYKWNKSIRAKISLMYIHDYIYSYYNGTNPATRGNPKNYRTAKNGWLFFQKNGNNSTPSYEWLSTRWGDNSMSDSGVGARSVNHNGRVGNYTLYSALGVRPVFYLSPKVKIASGDGTKENPYILSWN